MLSIFSAAVSVSPDDLPRMVTGLGFLLLIAAGWFWLRLALSPVDKRPRLIGMAGGVTGVAFFALGVGWFLPGLI